MVKRRGRLFALSVVSGRRGGAGAAGGKGPAGDSRRELFYVPVRCLLGAVVGSASGGEIALVGGAVGPRDGVVQVRVERLGLAAGGVAGGRAGTDEVLELPARGVVLFGVGVGVGVVAGAAGGGRGGGGAGFAAVQYPPGTGLWGSGGPAEQGPGRDDQVNEGRDGRQGRGR